MRTLEEARAGGRPTPDTGSAVAPDEHPGQWLALSYVPGLGPSMYLRLLAEFGAPGRVFRCGTEAARRFSLPEQTLSGLRSPDRTRAARELRWLEEHQGFLLPCTDPGFPPGLRQACPPVPFLLGRGDPGVLDRRQVAVVGSRRPSPQGLRLARHIAADLAAAGVVVTSGMARGIDGAAHEGALHAGGRSIAVFGTGLGRVYPADHHELAERIAAHGALLSEHSRDAPPLPEHFPRRNRIISALSAATLVVEADLRSGSLITARHALEQGREVFAVPGSVFNPLARGCHALLRQGATLAEGAEDLLRELGWETQVEQAERSAGDKPGKPGRRPPEHPGTGEPLSTEEQRLLEVVGWDPVSPDELARRSGLAAEILSASLFALEMRGYLGAQLDGRYCRLLPG